MQDKKNDILDKAEDVILKKIEQYAEHVHKNETRYKKHRETTKKNIQTALLEE